MTVNVIDIMANPRPGSAVDPVGQIHALGMLLDKLGLPGELAASRRLLGRSEELAAASRDGRAAAQERLAQVQRTLLESGPIDTDALARLLIEAGPWLDGQPDVANMKPNPAPAMVALMDVSRMARANAVAALAAEASGVHAKLAKIAHAVVVATAALPKPPREVWQDAQPDAAAVRVGYGDSMQRLWQASHRFDLVHQAAVICRATGGLGGEALLNGPPEPLGFTARNWPKAMGELVELKRVKPPLKLRWMVDHGWQPGLWTAGDLRGVEQEQPKRLPWGWLIPSPLRDAVGAK